MHANQLFFSQCFNAIVPQTGDCLKKQAMPVRVFVTCCTTWPKIVVSSCMIITVNFAEQHFQHFGIFYSFWLLLIIKEKK